MRLFHVTGNKNAEVILKEGFKEGFRGIRPGFHDGTGSYLTDREWFGVWISDKPFDDAHLSDGITLFAIEIPEEDISELEWPDFTFDLDKYDEYESVFDRVGMWLGDASFKLYEEVPTVV